MSSEMASPAAVDDFDELPFVIDKTGAPISDALALDRRKSTVFVRNLPFDFTDDQLQRKFAEVGPVKRAFIVTGKSKQGSKGFGFVIYADENDATDAVQQLHNTELGGRKIKVELARAPGSSATTADAPASRPRKPVRRRHFARKKPSPGGENIVILEGIDSNVAPKQLEKKLRKFGPVSVFDYPSAESTGSWPVARITFVNAETARKVVQKLDRKSLVVEGSDAVRAGWADLKCARVIVRNIPFNCKEPRLKLIMKNFGKIVDVHLPKDPEKGENFNKGFCFVQFEHLNDATKAVDQGSVKLGGRMVAIDWALSKAHYVSHKDDSDSDGSSSEMEDAGVCDTELVYAPDVDPCSEEDVNEDEAEHDENGVDGDSERNDDSDEGSDSDEADDKEENIESSNDDGGSKLEKTPRASRDVQEQRSVFIRNLPFEAKEDQIKLLFSRFGKVKSVKIVIDHTIGKPKGCAFVQFEESSAAAKAIEFASSGWSQVSNRMDKSRRIKTASHQGLQLGGRSLDVALAVDRSEAIHLQNENSKMKKEDKKRSHLAKEGYINPESDAAKGLNKIELAMRKKLYKETTKKLASPNYVMSNCRLSIHNLPDDIDEKSLRSTFCNAIKEVKPSAKPIVKQCIIVRDKSTLDKDGKPRSLHYGFIEFTEHDHALTALRALNNKPNGLGPKTHRPIVMFAVEDMRKLALRKARLVKSLQRSKVSQLQKELNGSLPNTAQVCGKRTRQNMPSESSRPKTKRLKK